jgi:hypothetical protein
MNASLIDKIERNTIYAKDDSKAQVDMLYLATGFKSMSY